VLTGVVLLVTGIPLWFPSLTGAGILRWSRFIHHAVFLLTVGGFIVHRVGRIPLPGTEIPFRDEIVLRVEAAEPRRVAKVVAARPRRPAEERREEVEPVEAG